MILLLIILVLFIIYSILVLFYWITWEKIPVYSPGKENPTTRISVIIPARNEEDNIEALLLSLQSQSYPKDLFEIIVVDDHSTDSTPKIVSRFSSVKLILLQEAKINSYKKKAIEKGIKEATGEWIVTTDADCIPSQNWLQTIASFQKKTGARFIAAPVVLKNNNSVLQLFQAMDFMVLQGITGAVVDSQKMAMCNGANISYEKKSFWDVSGFDGIDSIASGDDMLLMYKVAKKFPGSCFYLKSEDATVTTTPVKTWKTFFNQRIRWASKARKYEDKRVFPVLLLVYLFNLSFLVLGIAGIFNNIYWVYLGALLLTKTFVELPLFFAASQFFHKRDLLLYFFFFQPFHIIYTLAAGFFSQFGKYEWKGRRVK